MSTDNAKPVKGSGKKGESLFHSVIINILAKDVYALGKRYNRQLSLLQEADDERLQAIVCSLAVEEVLDTLLDAYIPKYSKYLKKNEDFTFSLKTELARSLNLIPSHLVNAIDIIRQIRNDFAHDLNIQTFDGLSETRKTRLINVFQSIHHEDDIKGRLLSVMFCTLASSLLAIIGAYSTNVRVARDYIYSDDFYKEIIDIAKTLKTK